MALSHEISGEALPDESTYRRSSSSDSSCEKILIEEDGDYVICNEEQLPLKPKKVLGRGYSAVVDKVQHRRTKEIFARKTVKIPRGKLKVHAEDRYQNEVDIIRSLKSHHHVIRLFATYITKRKGCLLLQPAANEGDLQDYLDNYADALDATPRHSGLDDMARVLEQAFGCLSSALAYMHKNGIRHKDIKPQNILIHQGRVIYTDFGASKDTRKDGESTTEGLPDFLTRKYSPPEVLEHDKRNFAADVYSLGCVFIEMLCAMSRSIDHDQEHGESFSHIMDDIHAKLLSGNIPPKLSFLAGTIVQMTMRDPVSRLDSDNVTVDICGREGFFCPSCHSGSQETTLNWSEQYQRWYWVRYNQTTESVHWEFSSWIKGRDSIARPMFNRQGRMVQGPYNVYNTEPAKHSETFDQSFCVRDPNYFQVGRCFAVLFSEPSGTSTLNRVTNYNSAISEVMYSEVIHTQVRRVIVVQMKRSFCYAIPIFTYGGRGTMKPGIAPDEYAIAYSYASHPQLFSGEQQLTKAPIPIVMNHGERNLSSASRIHFGIHHPIQSNVKVKDLGYVHPDWVTIFLSHWTMENEKDMQHVSKVIKSVGVAREGEYASLDGEDSA